MKNNGSVWLAAGALIFTAAFWAGAVYVAMEVLRWLNR